MIVFTVIGIAAVAAFALLVLAIAVGRFFDRKPDAAPEDWDPAPRNRIAPHVVPPWHPGESDLDDPNSPTHQDPDNSRGAQ